MHLPHIETLVLVSAPQTALTAFVTGSLTSTVITPIALATLFLATYNAVDILTSQTISSGSIQQLLDNAYALGLDNPKDVEVNLLRAACKYSMTLWVSSLVCSVAAAVFSCYILPTGASLFAALACVAVPFFLFSGRDLIGKNMFQGDSEDANILFFRSFEAILAMAPSYEDIRANGVESITKPLLMNMQLYGIGLLYKSSRMQGQSDAYRKAADLVAQLLNSHCAEETRQHLDVVSSTEAINNICTYYHNLEASRMLAAQ